MVLAMASCASIGAFIPESGKSGERIKAELLAADLGIEAVGASSQVDGFDRNYTVSVWLDPQVELTPELLHQTLTIAVPLITQRSIRSLELSFYSADPNAGADGAEPTMLEQQLDASGPLTELLAAWPERDRWTVKPDSKDIRVSMSVARDYVNQEG